MPPGPRKQLSLAAHRALHRFGPTRAALERRRAQKGVRFYREFLGGGELCFDVGANVGDRTRLFRQLGATVVAVEPQRACIAELKRRFEGDAQVAIVQSALGAAPGKAEIAISESDPTISTMSARWRTEGRFAGSGNWTGTEEVEVTTLDRLIEEHGRPKFCKIDVEGYEEQVLAGLSEPIPYTSFEFTREFLDDARKCVSHLGRIGSIEVSYSPGESMALAGDWADPGTIFARLDASPEPGLWGDIYVRSRAATES
jgi:FkbM family methyltransferase